MSREDDQHGLQGNCLRAQSNKQQTAAQHEEFDLSWSKESSETEKKNLSTKIGDNFLCNLNYSFN